MKIVLACFWTLLISAMLLSGCGTVSAIRSIFHAPTISAPSNSSPATTPAKQKSAVQSAVEKIVVWFWIGGALSVIAGLALIYFAGQIVIGVKCIIGGVLAPILATWFSMHYAVILICTVIGLIVWYVLTHAAARAELKSLLADAETGAAVIAADIKKKV